MYNLPVPPKFGQHSYKDKITVKAGSSLALELPFTASPMPEVTWTFQGRTSAPDARRFQVCLVAVTICATLPA